LGVVARTRAVLSMSSAVRSLLLAPSGERKSALNNGVTDFPASEAPCPGVSLRPRFGVPGRLRFPGPVGLFGEEKTPKNKNKSNTPPPPTRISDLLRSLPKSRRVVVGFCSRRALLKASRNIARQPEFLEASTVGSSSGDSWTTCGASGGLLLSTLSVSILSILLKRGDSEADRCKCRPVDGSRLGHLQHESLGTLLLRRPLKDNHSVGSFSRSQAPTGEPIGQYGQLLGRGPLRVLHDPACFRLST